jgi:REP element-mobilizing transposase RayT
MENYDYFLRLCKKYILPIADLYAYCLLPNHFHLLLRIKEKKESNRAGEMMVSGKFGTFLGTYVKAINNSYKRTGSLFEGRYQRVEMSSENQLIRTLVYIHQNPQKHGYVKRFQSWQFSSNINYAEKDPGDMISSDLFSDPLIYDSIMELHRIYLNDGGSH